jgi:YD repeat-containing protein
MLGASHPEATSTTLSYDASSDKLEEVTSINRIAF